MNQGPVDSRRGRGDPTAGEPAANSGGGARGDGLAFDLTQTRVSGRRYAAHLIDGIVLTLVAIVPLVAAAAISNAAIAVTFAFFLIPGPVLYYVLTERRSGRSPGKYAVGIRVVTASGEVPSDSALVKRTIPLLFEYIFILAWVAMMSSDSRQRLGDRWAGTYVIDDVTRRGSGSTSTPSSLAPARRALRAFGFLMVGILTIGLIVLIIDAVTTTGEEAAREAAGDFLEAFANGDGETACGLLTAESRREQVAAANLAGAASLSCPRALRAYASSFGSAINDYRALGSRGFAAQLDGSTVSIDASTELVSSAYVVRRIDGRWLVDLAGSGANVNRLATLTDTGISQGEVMAAADVICRRAFATSAPSMVRVFNGAGARSLVKPAQNWRRTERKLVDQLRMLAKVRRTAVAGVIGSHAKVLGSLRQLTAGAKISREQSAEVHRLSRDARLKAARSGFAEAGCARPIA